MTASYFFGYGSLVNQSTHVFEDHHRARLAGWRRRWQHTSFSPTAFLSVARAADCAIDGLIAHVPNDDWHALDARETGYDRVPTTEAVTHPVSSAINIAVYTVPDDSAIAPETRHPILLSYLDVVVQGYFQNFGATGVTDFFATTDGWDAPILNDRAAPRYPRHRVLSAQETGLVDQHLDALGIQPA